MADTTPLPFWKTKRLQDMTEAEWESLCDGCGLCCMHKLENADSGEIIYTEVSCTLLDCNTCQCSDYENRKKTVPDCTKLTPESVYHIGWLPPTCGYRIVASGGDLEEWHPLVSGDPNSVHEAGISVRDVAINEKEIDDLEHFVEDWINHGGHPFLRHPSEFPERPGLTKGRKS